MDPAGDGGQTDRHICVCASTHGILGEQGINPVQLNMNLVLAWEAPYQSDLINTQLENF